MLRRSQIVLAAIAFCVAGCQADRTNADMVAIRADLDLYAKAVDTADTGVIEKLWSAHPEVSFVHPLGQAHGLSQIESFYTDTFGKMFTDRVLTIRDPLIHVYGETAWVEFQWDFNAKLASDHSAVLHHGRETQIYHREQDGWRLVHVHYSAMPASQ